MSKYELIKSYHSEINICKMKLRRSDYKAIKFAEGELTSDEYADIRIERRALRAKINELEAKIEELKG